jgi:spore maturation protein A
MLNYIWAGLIIFSLVFALYTDVQDLRRDTYRNGGSLPVVVTGAQFDSTSLGTTQNIKVCIDPAEYKRFYGVDEKLVADGYAATLVPTPNGKQELRFAAAAALPPRLAKVRDMTSGDDPKWLLAEVYYLDPNGLGEIRFQPVRWVSMQAIGDAAINMARTAVELAIKLIGTLALFLGIMQIAEKAGLINLVVMVTGPILRPLFPGIPKGHPAMGLVTLNLTANMLGLGNAATPFGIKAMEELQKLNKTTDTATNAMVMLLAMNTAGVQLLPPAMLYAVMGLRASELYFPILIVTGIGLIIAIIAAKALGALPGYRASDPDRLPVNVNVNVEAAR